MLSFFRKKWEFRRYRKKVFGSLAPLFGGFPPGELSNLQALLDFERLVQILHEEQSADAQESAMFAAAILMGRRIDLMPSAERTETLDALQRGDRDHVMSAGIVHMFEIAKSMASASHLKMLGCEIVGKLRGMKREHIRTWRARQDFANIVSVLRSQAA